MFALPTSTFIPYGVTTFHVDGGANVNGIIDKNLFYFFIEDVSGIKQVGGDKIVCSGWGGIIIKCGDRNQIMAPVYYCPNNPRNTLSPSTFTNFCGCQSTLIHTNKYLDINYKTYDTVRFEFKVHNDLDHINLVIQQFHEPLVIASSILPSQPQRSPRLQMIENKKDINSKTPLKKPVKHVQLPVSEKLNNNEVSTTLHMIDRSTNYPTHFEVYHNDKLVTMFDRKVMSIIATFCVLLQPDASPRSKEI